MSATAERERLIGDLLRLRHAERESSGQVREQIAIVRVDLERMVGATVSRALAARLLGVSQTGLERWTATKDIPVLITPSGGRGVPLRALVELIEDVQAVRRSNRDDPHALGSALRRRRAAAARLNPAELLGASARHGHDGHRAADLRGLAYHRAVARRLDERVVRDAEERLKRWSAEGRIDPRYAQAWEQIVAKPTARIARLIGEDSQRMRELRQSSPFSGSLSEPERQRALSAVDELT